MYNPDQFREERPEVLRAFIAQHPLGALIVVTAEGLTANHIPMLWQEREGTPGILSACPGCADDYNDHSDYLRGGFPWTPISGLWRKQKPS